MPEPSPPSWVMADSTPGMDAGTNEAMPRFAGRANPGEVIKFSVDGQEHTVQPTPDGSWTWTSPELADGDHEFEMWTENADGEASPSVEWENHVQAGAADREWQRARNQQWREQGAPEFLRQNDELARETSGTPPRPMTGGGGGGGGGGQDQPLTDPVPPSASGNGSGADGAGAGSPSGSAGDTGGTRTRGGASAGAGGSPAAELEKGNAISVG